MGTQQVPNWTEESQLLLPVKPLQQLHRRNVQPQAPDWVFGEAARGIPCWLKLSLLGPIMCQPTGLQAIVCIGMAWAVGYFTALCECNNMTFQPWSKIQLFSYCYILHGQFSVFNKKPLQVKKNLQRKTASHHQILTLIWLLLICSDRGMCSPGGALEFYILTKHGTLTHWPVLTVSRDMKNRLHHTHLMHRKIGTTWSELSLAWLLDLCGWKKFSLNISCSFSTTSSTWMGIRLPYCCRDSSRIPGMTERNRG